MQGGNPIFKQMECACLYTPDIVKSVDFYKSQGLTEIYRDERINRSGTGWELVGLRFPEGGSDIFLQNNPELKETDVEIVVDDVREKCSELTKQYPDDTTIIVEPFSAGAGTIAVVSIPGETVVVLVGR